MATKYTTRTASLKATTADVRKLKINGLPFSKVVTDNVPETPTENDIWKYAVTTDDEGVVTITDDVTVDYTELTDAQKNITKTATKIIDNKVLGSNDELLMNWDTKSFTNSNNSDMNSIFGGSPTITEWDSDLSSLTNGYGMFSNTALTSWNIDLPNLTNGSSMFSNTALTSWNIDLPNLTNGSSMFSNTALTSWNIDLSSLTNSDQMFADTALESFTKDLLSLTNGTAMFGNCTSLTSFNGDLSKLTNGSSMFQGCKLDPQSVMIIAKSIRDITTEKASLTSSDYVTRTGSGTTDDPYIYSKPFGWMSDGSYVYTYNDTKPYTTTISASNVGQLTIGINVSNNSSRLQKFAEAEYYDSWDALEADFTNKGWTVTWEFNGIESLIYNDCITVEDCATVNSEYAYDVDENGAWNHYLDNLENADEMFVVGMDEETGSPIGSPALVSFNADLPKVTTGMGTFAGCSNLTTFSGDLSNLSDGSIMFGGCPKLTSFTSDLSSLTMTMFMFGCNYEMAELMAYDLGLPPEYIEMLIKTFGPPTSLDIASVQNIANTINTVSSGTIQIGIDPTLEGNSDIEAALTTIRNKGWDVMPMYGIGSPYVPTPGEGLLKYNNCKTFEHCRTIDANVATDVDENGAWNYSLDNLRSGGCGDYSSEYDGLFMIYDENGKLTSNTSLVSFNVDLPNLTDGTGMFMQCQNLTSFSGDLPKLTNGQAMFCLSGLTEWNIDLPNLTNGGAFLGNGMFEYCTKLTSFSGDLPKLTNGQAMFRDTGLTEWNIDLPNLTNAGDFLSNGMFRGTALTEWNIDLPKLTKGSGMFRDTGLTEWNIDLPKLTNGSDMFYNTGLTEWNIPLPNLTDGSSMFYNTGLTSWNIDLPKLTKGSGMFQYTALTSWNIPLPKLTNGQAMFGGCTNLTSFTSDLSALTNGSGMFGSATSNCPKLDLASVQNIAETINDLTGKTSDDTDGWGKISIGISSSIQGNADLATALAAIVAKGWTVTEIYRS